MNADQIANLRERVLRYRADGQKSEADYLEECLDEIERLQKRELELMERGVAQGFEIEHQSRRMAEAVGELKVIEKLPISEEGYNRVLHSIALLERKPAP